MTRVQALNKYGKLDLLSQVLSTDILDVLKKKS